jgi:hypothetical protein
MIKNILVEIDYVNFDFVGGFLEDFTVGRLHLKKNRRKIIVKNIFMIFFIFI